MRHNWPKLDTPRRSSGDVMSGMEVYLIAFFLCGVLAWVLPPVLLAVAWIVIILLLQFLWHIGFFKYDGIHSRHDREVARKIRASQRRLRRELGGHKDPGVQQPQLSVYHFPVVDWVCPGCSHAEHMDRGERYCMNCGYQIR
jgi:hypothetical protein